MNNTIVTVFLCIIAADFITGVVHWFEDTYGLPSWPIIGETVIRPNMEHHKHPSLIGTMGSLISRNYQPLSLTALSVLLLWSLGAAYWPLVLTAVIAGCGNEVHTWAHRKHTSRVVRFLQDAAIVTTPQQHAKHHRGSFDTYYCTITNFTNALLESINFWRGMEYAVSKVLRVHPNRNTAQREYV